MNRGHMGQMKLWSYFPRASGDEPRGDLLTVAKPVFSPREWG